STGGSSLLTGTSYTTPSINTTTTYYVDATNNGCTTGARTAVIATVNTLPVVTAASIPTSGAICIGSNATLNGAGATSYTWTGGVTNGTAFAQSQ
ncbi:MAG: hypothetical protein NTW92_07655, partial [Bacteroidetes bacterium]|nr:hypothetical protein [Bacteroidota bacterium]